MLKIVLTLFIGAFIFLFIGIFAPTWINYIFPCIVVIVAILAIIEVSAFNKKKPSTKPDKKKGDEKEDKKDGKPVYSSQQIMVGAGRMIGVVVIYLASFVLVIGLLWHFLFAPGITGLAELGDDLLGETQSRTIVSTGGPGVKHLEEERTIKQTIPGEQITKLFIVGKNHKIKFFAHDEIIEMRVVRKGPKHSNKKTAWREIPPSKRDQMVTCLVGGDFQVRVAQRTLIHLHRYPYSVYNNTPGWSLRPDK